MLKHFIKMAIYHCSAKIIRRSHGQSSVAAAAYRSGSRLFDERKREWHDYSSKRGVDYCEVMLPDVAQGSRWCDRSLLWNEVEYREGRVDSQLAREFTLALPRELSFQQNLDLARGFIQEEFVTIGMIADLALHNMSIPDPPAMRGKKGRQQNAPVRAGNPHAHVMLSMRSIELDKDGQLRFGNKNREWNSREWLRHLRQQWETHVNAALERYAPGAEKVDSRSLEDQGLRRVPQIHRGSYLTRMGQELKRLHAQTTLVAKLIAPKNQALSKKFVNLDEMRLKYRQLQQRLKEQRQRLKESDRIKTSILIYKINQNLEEQEKLARQIKKMRRRSSELSRA
jgi:ATP-dependent exoDNAse (exonuclease V) alpha subunit